MPKKLKAPKGTDEANIDGHSYRVDNSGEITVEDSVDTAPLVELGGFTEIRPAVEIPDGHALVVHNDPEARTEGEKIDGAFLVPAHKVAELTSHGFKAVEHVAADPEARKPE